MNAPRGLTLLAFLQTVLGSMEPARADLSLAIAAPVEHPAAQVMNRRSEYAWRTGSGAWGESLARQTMALRGFNHVYEIKRSNGQGIDLIAAKRNPAGQLIDARIVEVKTFRGTTARLGSTAYGKQMSRSWLAQKFREMRATGDPEVRNLALEVSRFRKSEGIPLVRFGELHEINTRTGRFIRRNPVSHAVLSEERIDDLLRRVSQRAPSRDSRLWAVRSLGKWDHIAQTDMSAWVRHSSAVSRIPMINRSTGLGRVLMRSGSRSIVGPVRAAGPIGAIAGAGTDAYEVYSDYSAYRRGELGSRELAMRLAEAGGGISGTAAGAAAGAWIGAFGGPVAWITVPVGGIAGGVVGYFAGSSMGGVLAEAWYSHLDEQSAREIDDWILETRFSEVELQMRTGHR